MTATESILWTKIKNFSLDDDLSGFKFSNRLARENGWSTEYTNRVIEEYKKFIFLCCVSPSGVTPSDPVDQAWHLHLTYTKSYWVDFCQKTLKQEIHHTPTKGGDEEGKKFDEYYTYGLNFYVEKFSTTPPPDIWHNNITRFSDINFQRVNMTQYALVKRSTLSTAKKRVLVLLVLGIIILFVMIVRGFFRETEIPLFVIALFCMIGYAVYSGSTNERKGQSDRESQVSGGCGGDGSSGCGTDSHHHGGHDSHSGDHGCSSSGCSGCSSSGCSGCGGGGD